ncbi:hypothetical protein ACFQZO_08515 [Bradyrhizobium sp. GCM10027634]|uniref:hypothetical protein n=1 Tax=unclassified Bradyrhizobium TaxID=2631580 RepID=UPI00263AEB5F|nr:hypothetical protein [Bradyrhizobium sp. WYCCWR 12677]MDN5000923.1 hypothetical protein [Bradyrhizobium sp. WYCCWR 12677]
MSIDHAASCNGISTLFNSRRVRSRCTKAVIFSGCLVVNLISMTDMASAHVKWFVPCIVSNDPLPIQAVFTTTFFLFLALFLALFYLACAAEQTTVGLMLSRFLDHVTEPLRRRVDDLLRGAAAVFFALLWAHGGLILTPELEANSIWLSAIQLLIPLFLAARPTLPAAGAAILLLYGYGAACYGLFHMLDYPVFLGLGVWFVLSVSRDAKLLAFRSDFLRWTVALSLLWPSMEKFVYPAWVAAIAVDHPELTLGFDVSTVVTAAGIVEFGLAFALFWTPLVRRLSALALLLVLTAATLDFGKVDGIGHLMIVAILFVVLADREDRPAQYRPALAPLISSMALPATLLLYTGAHTLSYASLTAPIEPLAGGAALLLLVFLCLRRFAGHSADPRHNSEQDPVRQVPLRASMLVVSPDAAPEVAFGGVALAAVMLIALGLHGHELKVPPSGASAAPRQQHST